MRIALLVPTALIATSALLALASAETPAVCTEAQTSAYYLGAPSMCLSFQYDFQVCPDDCLAGYKTVNATAAKCVEEAVEKETLADKAAEDLNVCGAQRASRVEKYTPRATPGLPSCTDAQRNAWDEKYTIPDAYSRCRDRIRLGDTCSLDCLANLEAGVLGAPVCARTGLWKDYWLGESEKKDLQACILSRGGSIKENDAMQALPDSAGVIKIQRGSTSSVPTAVETKAPASNATKEVCTDEEIAAYSDAKAPYKCRSLKYEFQVCTDDCLEGYTTQEALAPNCLERSSSKQTLAEEAAAELDACNVNRAITDKYMPRPMTGLPKCTSTQIQEMSDKFGIAPAYVECRVAFGTGNFCSSDCLKNFEKAVVEAPACETAADYTGYWMGEPEKANLQTCLLSRGESVTDNVAMNTYPKGAGTLLDSPSSSSASSKPSAAANATNAPAASSSAETMAAVSALAVGASLATVVLSM